MPRRGYRNASCGVILAGDAALGREVRPSGQEKTSGDGDGDVAPERCRGVRRGHGTH